MDVCHTAAEPAVAGGIWLPLIHSCEHSSIEAIPPPPLPCRTKQAYPPGLPKKSPAGLPGRAKLRVTASVPSGGRSQAKASEWQLLPLTGPPVVTARCRDTRCK